MSLHPIWLAVVATYCTLKFVRFPWFALYFVNKFCNHLNPFQCWIILLAPDHEGNISFKSWLGSCSSTPTFCVLSLNFKNTEFVSCRPGYTGRSVGLQPLLAQDIPHVFVRESVHKCVEGNILQRKYLMFVVVVVTLYKTVTLTNQMVFLPVVKILMWN